MGVCGKKKRDADEEESGRVLIIQFQTPSAFRQDPVLGTVGGGSLHMFLEDRAGHADRPVDLLLLLF